MNGGPSSEAGGRNGAALISLSDQAMYRAKANGKNTYEFAGALLPRIERRMSR